MGFRIEIGDCESLEGKLGSRRVERVGDQIFGQDGACKPGYTSKVPSGNQTWLAGKSTIYFADFPSCKLPCSSGIYQQTRLDFSLSIAISRSPATLDYPILFSQYLPSNPITTPCLFMVGPIDG